MNIKIDLGEFFEDDRKQSLLFIDTEEKRLVSEIIEYICEIFDIDSSSCPRESLYFLADGIYIPEKQPSLVLKEVKDVLSLKRGSHVRRAGVASKSNSELLCLLDDAHIQYKKQNKEQQTIGEVSHDSVNDSNEIVLEAEKDKQRHEQISLEGNDIYSSCLENQISVTVKDDKKRKKHKKRRLDCREEQTENFENYSGKDSICCKSPKWKEGGNNYVSPKDSFLQLDENFSASVPIDEQKKRRKKHKSRADNTAGMLCEENGCEVDHSSVSHSRDEAQLAVGESYFCSNDADINYPRKLVDCYHKQKKIKKINNGVANGSPLLNDFEDLSPVVIHSSVVSPVENGDEKSINKYKFSTDYSVKNEENVTKKDAKEDDKTDLDKNDSLNCNVINSIDFSSEATHGKAKRKRKHKKKKRSLNSDFLNNESNKISVIGNSEPEFKMFKTLDNLDQKNKHTKFDSDSEEFTCKESADTFEFVQQDLSVIDNALNQNSTRLINTPFYNPIDSFTPTIIELQPVSASPYQNCSKEPPSSLQTDEKERNIDSFQFASILKLEKSKEVSVFERLKLKQKQFSVMLPPVLSTESPQKCLPHSPPSPEISDSISPKKVNSLLYHCQEMEKSSYPHVFYRRKLLLPSCSNNTSENQEILNISKEGSLEGLPISFTSNKFNGKKNSSKESFCSLNGEMSCELKEHFVEFQNFKNVSALNDSSNETECVSSFRGARPKKTKEKKVYSSVGGIIKSLKLSQQNDAQNIEPSVDCGVTALKDFNSNLDNVSLTDSIVAHSNKSEFDNRLDNTEVLREDHNSSSKQIVNDINSEEAESRTPAFTETNESNTEQTAFTKEMKESQNLNYFYKSCPLLHSIPNVGDIIAAKVMTLDDTYSPCFTDYRPAKVQAVSGLTLSLLFLDYGDFTADNIKKNMVPPNGKALTVSNIDWRDLKEVRLLFP